MGVSRQDRLLCELRSGLAGSGLGVYRANLTSFRFYNSQDVVLYGTAGVGLGSDRVRVKKPSWGRTQMSNISHLRGLEYASLQI